MKARNMSISFPYHILQIDWFLFLKRRYGMKFESWDSHTFTNDWLWCLRFRLIPKLGLELQLWYHSGKVLNWFGLTLYLLLRLENVIRPFDAAVVRKNGVKLLSLWLTCSSRSWRCRCLRRCRCPRAWTWFSSSSKQRHISSPQAVSIWRPSFCSNISRTSCQEASKTADLFIETDKTDMPVDCTQLHKTFGFGGKLRTRIQGSFQDKHMIYTQSVLKGTNGI